MQNFVRMPEINLAPESRQRFCCHANNQNDFQLPFWPAPLAPALADLLPPLQIDYISCDLSAFTC